MISDLQNIFLASMHKLANSKVKLGLASTQLHQTDIFNAETYKTSVLVIKSKQVKLSSTLCSSSKVGIQLVPLCQPAVNQHN